MYAIAIQPASELLFEPEELDSGAFPGCVRRLVITESSPQLARIHEKRAEQNRAHGRESGRDRDQAYMDWLACRNVIATVINVAVADIQTALRQENPRLVRFTHRNRTKMLANEAFDSAVGFLFGMQHTAVTDEHMRVTRANYSAFNTYCVLMGWSAPVFRRRLLTIFPAIGPLIHEVLQESNLILAPVADSV